MTLSIKIKNVRKDALKVTQSQFAKKLGFSRIATISDYEKGKRTPDVTTLRKIAELGNTTIDWLLSEGESLPPALTSKEQDTTVNRDYINISVYEANIPDINFSEPKSLPIEDFLVPKKHYNKNTLAIRFEGLSMNPTILNGAILGINKTDKDLSSGKLIALWMKQGGLIVRRVFVYPDRIELKPDNNTFLTITVKTEDISDDLIVGNVAWIFQGI